MSYKVFSLDNEREVTVIKRKGSRHLRLTIDSKGTIKVSIPTWAPYQAGLNFALSKQAWIAANHTSRPLLQANQPIGKAHHLEFIVDDSKFKPSSRISSSTIQVYYPSELNVNDTAVQEVTEKACIRALRQQAEALLPQRLNILAKQHDFNYKSVSIKNLKSRWGSCDQDKNIVLSLFLMQMPWQLIDYVILHELTHTDVLRHGPPFWQALEKTMPDAKSCRNKLRTYQPILMAN
jgi:predicted metal-dependent hydrolase